MPAAKFDLEHPPWNKPKYDFDSDQWGDEQDRSDWFAEAAHYWGARAARAEKRVKQLREEIDRLRWSLRLKEG